MHYRRNGLPKRKSGHWLCGICIVLLTFVFSAKGNRHDEHDDGNDIVHAHYYYDFEVGKDENGDPNPPLRIYSWHEHKNVRRNGDVTYAKQSHHGDNGKRNTITQNGDGHDGPMVEPEPRPQRESEQRQTITTTPRTTTIDDSDYAGAGDTCHTWDFTESPYIGFPVLPHGVETIGGFRSYLHKRIKKWVKIGLLIDGQWQWYPTNDELKYTLITPHLGVYVSYRDSDLEVCGEPLAGESLELTVPEGDRGAIFLVGIPEVPANYEMRSDLLANNLTWLKRKVWIGDLKNTENEYVSRQRRVDDTEIKPGQAFMIRVTGDVNLNLGGNVPAAPSAQRQPTLATTWGAMKQ